VQFCNTVTQEKTLIKIPEFPLVLIARLEGPENFNHQVTAFLAELFSTPWFSRTSVQYFYQWSGCRSWMWH